ncbi:exodeoxyribonuclease VII small subunit [Viridibacterium curvum]|uniref:Exodeoxyribonuclease 7 small subunit n=1 Tax=Viridibacterium curvum TaxID=1101404 RepID=A0ABP9QX18_9RHOO
MKSADAAGKRVNDADSSIPSRFEDAVAELEALVVAMEGGDLSLEDSLRAFERGSVLLRHCRSTLESAEQRIRVLENDALKDFDPGQNNNS